jgi:hypothetical protein
MNEYQARRISTTGKWHYTRSNGTSIAPAGYCAQMCAGHETPDEAAEHFRQYILDTASYDVFKSVKPGPCVICHRFTRKLVRTNDGSDMRSLCEKHANREGLERVLC